MSERSQPADPEVLNAQQVADLLHMHVQMVRRMAREGRLPAYRLPGGRSFRFFKQEILEHLKNHPVTEEGTSQ